MGGLRSGWQRASASRWIHVFQRFNCLFGPHEGPVRTIAVALLPNGSAFGALGSQANEGVIVPGSSIWSLMSHVDN
jgi:hypothetical protein